MGKNKRNYVEVFDLTHNILLSVDSQEECDFINFCNEAVSLSILNDFVYQPCSFQLSDPVKYIDVNGKERSLYQDHVYSPDFILTFNPSEYLDFSKEFKINQSDLSCQEVSVYIDIKGTFQKNKRSFMTDRKWVWQKFNIYINEIIPSHFFKSFGVPEKSMLTNKTKKPRTMFQGFKSLKEIFKIS